MKFLWTYFIHTIRDGHTPSLCLLGIRLPFGVSLLAPHELEGRAPLRLWRCERLRATPCASRCRWEASSRGCWSHLDSSGASDDDCDPGAYVALPSSRRWASVAVQRRLLGRVSATVPHVLREWDFSYVSLERSVVSFLLHSDVFQHACFEELGHELRLEVSWGCLLATATDSEKVWVFRLPGLLTEDALDLVTHGVLLRGFPSRVEVLQHDHVWVKRTESLAHEFEVERVRIATVALDNQSSLAFPPYEVDDWRGTRRATATCHRFHVTLHRAEWRFRWWSCLRRVEGRSRWSMSCEPTPPSCSTRTSWPCSSGVANRWYATYRAGKYPCDLLTVTADEFLHALQMNPIRENERGFGTRWGHSRHRDTLTTNRADMLHVYLWKELSLLNPLGADSVIVILYFSFPLLSKTGFIYFLYDPFL